MAGKLPVFRMSEVSLADIEELINIGYRFELKEELPDGERFDDLERYIENGKNRIRLRACLEDRAKDNI